MAWRRTISQCPILILMIIGYLTKSAGGYNFFYITSLKTHTVTFYNYSRTFTFKTAMETWLKPRTEEIRYRRVERLTSQFYQLL